MEKRNKKIFFENNWWRIILLILGFLAGIFGWLNFSYFLIHLSSFLIAVFLPSFFIKTILLNELRKGINNIENNNTEYESLRYIPKTFGEFERAFIYGLLLYIFNSKVDSANSVIAFLGGWLALKVYVENKIWTNPGNIKEEQARNNFHIGRAKYLIHIIGTIVSISFIVIIFYLTQKLIL